ncbi:GNAT family N-acetyltransferase [Aurantiacibacter sp. MUD61]|uniref:GNAT family N-acetyltransferase n=1 Tax=Aurantiacibacter sp. MUD61 TaxID=3009083 RepID=UPI0022F008F9|nr:GNAT family N-acetyltransferase [Aurantiacibacter sp. MUD61]
MTVLDASKPMLVTERLELWLPKPQDMDAMFDIVSDSQTQRFLGPTPTYPDHVTRFSRNAGSWALYGYGMFLLRRRGDAELIGNCGIFFSHRGLGEDFDSRPEAGWIIAAPHTGKGYASEAMQAVMQWFDREHASETVCLITLGNDPSFRLAEKLGFRDLRKAEMPGGDAVQLLRRPPPGA